MAYQLSTTIANPAALIAAICTFAAANGWTVDRNNLVGSNRLATLHRSGSDYIHVYNVDADNVYLRLSQGYDGGLPPADQPNVAPAAALVSQLTGPYPSVWFFANGTELDVVVRRSDTAGAYAHLAFGVIQKYGTFTGGTYADGTNFPDGGSWSGTWQTFITHGLFAAGYNGAGFMRVDSDGEVNQFLQITGTPVSANVHVSTNIGDSQHASLYSSSNAYVSSILEGFEVNSADDNTFSGRSVFQVIEFAVQRAGSPTYFSPIGYVDNRRYASLAKFDPEQEVTIGGDTWVMFPVVRKAAFSSALDAPNASGNNGFAIKKVA